MSWEEFLERVADAYGLAFNEKTAFLEKLADKNADAKNAKVASNLSIPVVTLERQSKWESHQFYIGFIVKDRNECKI